jgi:hypothetical protein
MANIHFAAIPIIDILIRNGAQIKQIHIELAEHSRDVAVLDQVLSAVTEPIRRSPHALASELMLSYTSSTTSHADQLARLGMYRRVKDLILCGDNITVSPDEISCPMLKDFVRQACKPWSYRTHHVLFGPMFRSAIHALFTVQSLGLYPDVPLEMWFEIASRLYRGWFPRTLLAVTGYECPEYETYKLV